MIFARSSSKRTRAGSLILLSLLTLSGCSCQRPENVAAKKRLSSPAKTSPTLLLAKEALDVGKLATDTRLQARINRMQFSEVAARIGSGVLESEGKLHFDRKGFTVHSSEKNIVRQSEDGDFVVVNITSDESRQELIYANDALFLKNNNGKWRISRDPTGERIKLRNKSGGVWRSFYELFAHALEFKKMESEEIFGRNALRFSLRVADRSAEAYQIGKDDPLEEVREEHSNDAGVVVVKEKAPETMKRLSEWRKRSRAQSGGGDLWVDEKTGVILKVTFKGTLVVGDESTAATLNVEIASSLKDIGKPLRVVTPDAATSEVARVKLPVHPRAPFEKAGLAKPIVKEPKKSSTSKSAKKDSKAKTDTP
ncbi:MAG: hypothetical protein GY822_07505 [Deltaproteobacteria bacterium]|nr:hypothetical protein [Deltaproteobacteria bacterium]